MNKTLLFLLAAAVLCGCTKTTITQISSTVSGKWYIAADTVSQFNNGNETTSYSAVNSSNFTVFDDNGTGMKVISGDTIIFNYTAVKNKLTINYPAYVKNGINYAFAVDTGTIRSVTPNTLYLYLDNTQVNGNNTMRVVEKVSFKR